MSLESKIPCKPQPVVAAASDRGFPCKPQPVVAAASDRGAATVMS